MNSVLFVNATIGFSENLFLVPFLLKSEASTDHVYKAQRQDART